ncbi:MAG TPA: hypothetical protein VGV12_08355, partial [Gemmatimonadales bacterium]|nr:hypothetical protein [Gemmatimonadales bacterium]
MSGVWKHWIRLARVTGRASMLLVGLSPIAFPRSAMAQQDVTVTDSSFGCIRNGAKVRNTYIRNADSVRLRQAIRILRDSVPDQEYPIGTFLQLQPREAMVKHARARFPATNGWEFFALDVSATGTKIRVRGDSVVNFTGVTCLSCHQPAAKFDFVCEKGHGCAPIPIDDKKIAALQNA